VDCQEYVMALSLSLSLRPKVVDTFLIAHEHSCLFNIRRCNTGFFFLVLVFIQASDNVHRCSTGGIG